MEDNSDSPLLNEYLQSLKGMKAVEADPFFYTRLKGKMQQRMPQKQFSYKPAWAIITLAFFITINIWMIMQVSTTKQDTTEKKPSVQVFAETYNLNSDSNY
ncbi:MAG: hypothetical protein QM737_17320 [Ferruginibacter sp.]